jgi:hypothetical protein
MRQCVCLAIILSFVVPGAWAQGDKASAPNGASLTTMQRARSYAVTNQSDETIVSARARMTNGDERDLVWNEPLQPRHGRNTAVPSSDCLARLTVKFQSGRTMETGSPDCRQTRIIITNDALQVGSSASDRPPVQ